jgi:hypothetical protein
MRMRKIVVWTAIAAAGLFLAAISLGGVFAGR